MKAPTRYWSAKLSLGDTLPDLAALELVFSVIFQSPVKPDKATILAQAKREMDFIDDVGLDIKPNRKVPIRHLHLTTNSSKLTEDDIIGVDEIPPEDLPWAMEEVPDDDDELDYIPADVPPVGPKESIWLTIHEAERWFGLRTLAEKRALRAAIRSGEMPSVRFSAKTIRLHKPTLIARAQKMKA